MPRTILISGAASGLGHAFLRAYARDSNNTIITVDRVDREDVGLDGEKYPASVSTHTLDVTDGASVDRFATSLRGTAVDLFIHSVGVRGLVPEIESAHPDSVAAAETLHVMDLQTLMHAFHVNAAATFLLVRSLLPHLKRSADPKVVVMGSRMGSLGYNTAGGAYAYRASKAALNSIIKSFSIDVPEVTFVLCHPGRVESGLVRCKEEGAISAAESAEGLLPLIRQWNKDDSGKFYDRFGQPIVW